MVIAERREAISSQPPEVRHIKREVPGKVPVRFDGPLGYPGMPYTTPEGEKRQAVAVFNAGMETIAHPTRPGESINLAIARAKADPHIWGKPDFNKYLFAYTFGLSGDGFSWSQPQVIDTDTMKTKEHLEKGLGIEDLRLTTAVPGLAAAMTVVGEDGIPKVAVAKATLSGEGNQIHVEFTDDKTHILHDKNGEIEGKNGVVRLAPDGSWIVMYRPEFTEGFDANGYRNVNNDTFKFVKVDPKNLDKDAVALPHRDMVFPEVDGVVRWGWNGGNGKHSLPFKEGSHLEMVHYIEKVQQGEQSVYKYGFRFGVFSNNPDGTIRCQGIITKPFHTYEDQQALTPDLMQELNHEKQVIYSPGGIVDNGRFVIGVTVGDTGFGLLSWNVSDIQQFAHDAIEKGEFARSPVMLPDRRERPDEAA